MRVVALAATTSRVRFGTQAPLRGKSQVAAGPTVPRIVTLRKVVFGSTAPPGVVTFLDSW
jgi:hypothetical protein